MGSEEVTGEGKRRGGRGTVVEAQRGAWRERRPGRRAEGCVTVEGEHLGRPPRRRGTATARAPSSSSN
eukprot:6474581-Amphidinium_carterae.2